MGKLVNINGQSLEVEDCVYNGQSLEVEDCVYNGDELDIKYTAGVDPFEITEIPEEEQFIKEYIESDLDSQIDDQVFDKLLEEITTSKPDMLPSYLGFEDWLVMNKLDGKSLVDLRNEYDNEYVPAYRKELREWWIKKYPPYIFNEEGNIMMSDGISITKDTIEGSNKVKDMITNSINKSIDKELIS